MSLLFSPIQTLIFILLLILLPNSVGFAATKTKVEEIWKFDRDSPIQALYFDASSQNIYFSVKEGENSSLELLNKKGEKQTNSALVRGEVKKIFGSGERVFVFTARELISFDLQWGSRKKELDLNSPQDVAINGNGDIYLAKKDGVYRWKSEKKVKVFSQRIQKLFFDSFELLGQDDAGTVWHVLSGKTREMWQTTCSSVWKYSVYWLCVREDTVFSFSASPNLESKRFSKKSDKNRTSFFVFPEKITAFTFGYQKEEKDLFWVFSNSGGRVTASRVPKLE